MSRATLTVPGLCFYREKALKDAKFERQKTAGVIQVFGHSVVPPAVQVSRPFAIFAVKIKAHPDLGASPPRRLKATKSALTARHSSLLLTPVPRARPSLLKEACPENVARESGTPVRQLPFTDHRSLIARHFGAFSLAKPPAPPYPTRPFARRHAATEIQRGPQCGGISEPIARPESRRDTLNHND
jgi:hypothetical protein